MTTTATASTKDQPFAQMAEVLLHTTNLAIDTVVGLYFYLLDQGVAWDKLRIVLKVADLGDREALEFDALRDTRYRDLGKRSATEAYAEETGRVVLKDGRIARCTVPGLAEMLEMLADNNGTASGGQKGGYLKSSIGKLSFPWLFRKMEDISMGGKTKEERLTYWLCKSLEIIDTYFKFHALREQGEVDLDATGFFDSFPAIAEDLKPTPGFLDKPESLLTLRGHLVALGSMMFEDEWKSGAADKAITVSYEFWKRAFEKGDAVEVRADERAKEILAALKANTTNQASTHHRFGTQVGDAIFVHTDDENVGKHFWEALGHSVALLVIRGPKTRKASIMSRAGANVDLTVVASELKKIEPDHWHYEPRYQGGKAPMLLNGGQKCLDREPTALTDATLKELVRKHVRLQRR